MTRNPLTEAPGILTGPLRPVRSLEQLAQVLAEQVETRNAYVSEGWKAPVDDWQTIADTLFAALGDALRLLRDARMQIESLATEITDPHDSFSIETHEALLALLQEDPRVCSCGDVKCAVWRVLDMALTIARDREMKEGGHG